MPYSWETPITDRTQASYYNYTDPNRVDNNNRYLEEYVEAYVGYVIDLEAYTTATKTTLPTVETINLLERNINEIRDALTYDPNGWVTLGEDWTAGTKDAFDYEDANNLEVNQVILKTNFENIYQAFRRCGTFNTGSKLTRL
jgi:hypothetical protein